MIKAIICGATGIGKSGIAFKTAGANRFEIISADSRQVYNGIPAGTGQVPASWKREVPHHFMGFLPVTAKYSVNQYAGEVIDFLGTNRSADYIIVGGTGLYIKALLYPQKNERGPVPEDITQQAARELKDRGFRRVHDKLCRLDPVVAAKIHPNDGFRIAKAYENFLATGTSYRNFEMGKKRHPLFKDTPVIHVTMDREKLYRLIDQRVIDMVRNGWIEEVEGILGRGSPQAFPCLNALGYTQIRNFLEGKTGRDSAVREIQRKTRNYAKKQITFFRNQLPEALAIDYFRLLKNLEKKGFKWENKSFAGT